MSATLVAPADTANDASRADAVAQEIAARFAAAPSLVPFDDRTVAFTAALSRALAGELSLRRHGEVQALAFWLRPGEVRRLAQHFAGTEGPESVLVPRGTVFHVPPSNVDTLFVYSWVLALLVGNRSIVRLSQRLGGVGAQVAGIIERVLAEPVHADVAANTAFVRYGHDAERTAALSALCDVRVLWGGDTAVRTLRAIPLPPGAIELVFPDRYSAAALNTAAYEALAPEERDALADRFANDAFLFDQHACASPRLVAWIGDTRAMNSASADFWPRVVRAVDRRGITIDAGTALAKLTVAAQCAADEAVAHVNRVSPEVHVVRLDGLDGFRRVAPGGGLFHEVALPALTALAPYLVRRDQTLTAFGFGHDALRAAARAFNGRGIDRIVPVGQALAFHRVWDGYDLLQQFTRRMAVPLAGW
ncbi:MAG: hypothetical protein MUE41_09250 [Gemmatimonadaceae bacterium]|nr:hypothetical protein [Gemmatimonadaceae bacterium]